MIDDIAREVAIRRCGLAECLHVPIAAVDEAAISTHIGEVQSVLSGGRGAFIQYADLTELMLVLDLRLGGGVMDLVNEG